MKCVDLTAEKDHRESATKVEGNGLLDKREKKSADEKEVKESEKGDGL